MVVDGESWLILCPERNIFVFLGTYRVNFTGKGRLILPKSLREQLAGIHLVVLTRGLDGCIWGFAKTDWEKEIKRQLELGVTTKEGRNLRRYIFSQAQEVELDRQGRFVVEGMLLTYAGVRGEAVIIGAGDHFEIWSPPSWQKIIKSF